MNLQRNENEQQQIRRKNWKQEHESRYMHIHIFIPSEVENFRIEINMMTIYALIRTDINNVPN